MCYWVMDSFVLLPLPQPRTESATVRPADTRKFSLKKVSVLGFRMLDGIKQRKRVILTVVSS